MIRDIIIVILVCWLLLWGIKINRLEMKMKVQEAIIESQKEVIKTQENIIKIQELIDSLKENGK